MNIYNIDLSKNEHFTFLSTELSNGEKRLNFEKWLLKSFSPESATDKEYALQSKVIALLCTKSGADHQKENIDEEDHLIAALIAKGASANGQKNQGLIGRSFSQLIKLVHHSSAKTLNLAQINSALKDADLPYTGEVLLKKMLEKEEMDSLFKQALEEDNVSLFKAILHTIPERHQEIKNNIYKILQLTITHNSERILNFLIKVLPDACQEVLVRGDAEKNTLIHLVANQGNLDIATFFYQAFPETFKKSLTMQNKFEETPLHLAAMEDHIQMAEWMATLDSEALHILNIEGHSILSLVNLSRPQGYRRIKDLFAGNMEIKQLQKLLVERKGLSHAFHLKGNTRVMLSGCKKFLGLIELEGHDSPEWFRLISKNLTRFDDLYSNQYSKQFIPLFTHLCDLGAHYPHVYSNQELLEMIHLGMPVHLDTGYLGHRVSLLIWKDQLVICNRGGSSQSAIKVYHFDPKHIRTNDLEDILQSKNLSAENYHALFFERLPERLKLAQTELDLTLENYQPLPLQAVGNCSFISPITAIFAFMVLGAVHGVDHEGRLQEDFLPNPTQEMQEEISDRVEQAVQLYRLWLTNEQINFLERTILPLEAEELSFEPDHVLIVETLRKAHLLPLDSFCEKRLQNLTQLYLAYLNPEDRMALKCDLEYWKSLPREDLL